MIAILTIGVNLTGDAIARSLGRSYIPRSARRVDVMSDRCDPAASSASRA